MGEEVGTPLSPEEIRAVDMNAEFLGVSRLQLMENAGRGVVDALNRRQDLRSKSILVLAHTGNKGGDGFVSARHAASLGAKVSVVLLAKPDQISTEEARSNFLAVAKMRYSVNVLTAPTESELKLLGDLFGSADIIVDAMLGTGSKGILREPIRTAVRMANASEAFRVAIDVPTGIDAGSGEVMGDAFRAQLTVTHHKPKTGLVQGISKEFIGELEAISIGVPPEAEIFAGPGDIYLALKPRKAHSHKGDNGRLLVVGGSARYTGAPALAAMAALRTGIDLAVVAVPSSIVHEVRGYSPDLIVLPLPSREEMTSESLGILTEEVSRADAVVVGMGLGTSSETSKAVLGLLKILSGTKKPTVIDADAIKALGADPAAVRGLPSVITPHAGEFAALTGVRLPEEKEDGWKERLPIVKEWASRLGSTVLLKSRYDIITDGAAFRIKNIGNPGLTTGGTGDVLAGITGALLSRGATPFRAAVAASFLNSYAGDLLEREMGQRFTARDLVDALPVALKDLGF
ncbi:MAG: NAD(P)H-hydrate dehydratase [Candidatus Verstraetearchaeota archaeon]|nr:NAD(P)H-hydrate dehydratase [Candidatus Verstraetearchaeota archaeon]